MQHQFCQSLIAKNIDSAALLPTAAQKVVWTDGDGDPGAGAGLTLQHHSLDLHE
jgi:hypothetical protein